VRARADWRWMSLAEGCNHCRDLIEEAASAALERQAA
jgi:hypothetical protein